MTLQQRIDDLVSLEQYIKCNTNEWQDAKDRALRSNPWFTDEFIEQAVNNIVSEFLQKDKLVAWTKSYDLAEKNELPKVVGLSYGRQYSFSWVS